MFDTQVSAVPVSKSSGGLREWNDIVGQAFAGCSVDAKEVQFSGELWRCRINDVNLVRVRAAPSKVGRWLTENPQFSSGSVLLHLQSAGRSINRQRGRDVSIEEGGGALCDPDYKYTVDFMTPYEMFVVELPIPAIVAREPGFDLERFAGQKIECRRSQLLISFLRTAWLQRECLENDPDWRDCVSRTSLDLAMRAICQAGGHEVVGASAELRRAVIEHIRLNLSDTGLRTSSIARALEISPRTVQTVFERLATTTSGFILEQRLDRAAHRLIQEPGRLRITDLAFECGFSDSAYFSRCFKRRFGVAAREYRRDGPAQNI
jgi:AraC-like DNA-binding protein